MSFIDNIKSELKENFLPCNYRAIILGNNSIYIENVKGIKSYSASVIELYIGGGILEIKGESLSVSKYCLGDLVICGKLKSFVVL